MKLRVYRNGNWENTAWAKEGESLGVLISRCKNILIENKWNIVKVQLLDDDNVVFECEKPA